MNDGLDRSAGLVFRPRVAQSVERRFVDAFDHSPQLRNRPLVLVHHGADATLAVFPSHRFESSGSNYGGAPRGKADPSAKVVVPQRVLFLIPPRRSRET